MDMYEVAYFLCKYKENKGGGLGWVRLSLVLEAFTFNLHSWTLYHSNV